MPQQTPIDFEKLGEAFHRVCEIDAPLRERLAIFEAAVRAHGVPFAEVYDDLVARLETGSIGEATPEPGEAMPTFCLPDLAGRLVRLEALLETGPLVISFNRGHWCEYCGIELKTLADEKPDIAALGARIVSIMPEHRGLLAKVDARTGGQLILLSDQDNGYALSLGLVIWLGDRVRQLYLEHNLRIDTFQGNDAWFVPVPATFVIGRDGVIAARFVDPDFRKRMEIEEILAALRSLAS